jgi:hypothetical protein
MTEIFRTKRRPDMMKTAFAVTIVILAVAVLTVISGISGYKKKYGETYLNNVKSAVYDTLITCYALEGSYPANLEYLSDHYGLVLDKSRYIFRYDLTGSNLFPDFEVVPYSKSDKRTPIYEEGDP